MNKRFFVCCLVAFAVCFSVFLVSASGALVETKEGILSFAVRESNAQSTQDFITNVLPARIGIDAEWYVLGLARDGDYDFSAYAEALVKYVNENTVTNAVTRQKYALALLASGYCSDFVQQTADECVGQLGLMSFVWALHLAENGLASRNMTAEQIVDRILEAELSDGGFAVAGNNFNVDATAMVLQALAPYAENERVAAVTERGLNRLSSVQTDNGGFVAYGEENAESSAQVLMMMACLNIDVEDSRFVKNGNTVLDALLSYRCESGGFSHTLGAEISESASAQAYLALVSWENGSCYQAEYTDGLQDMPYVTESAQSETAVSWRIYAWIAIGAVTVTACLVLTVCGKRKSGNYLFVLFIGAVLGILVFSLNIESKDGYYEGADQPKENIVGTVTLEIRCDVIANGNNASHVPTDGVILREMTFDLAQGESVFDILDEAARRYRIPMEHDGSSKLAYVRGIAYIYELEYGDLSGWIYRVNGKSPSVGCGAYILRDGDRIVWHYSLAQGEDIP